MSELAVHSEKLFDLLKNGPMPYDVLVANVAAAVHPGKAFRSAYSKVEAMRERNGYEERIYSDPDAIKQQRIRYGQTTLASKTIADYIKRGRLTTFDEDGVTMVAPTDKPVGLPSVMSRITPWTRLIVGMLGGEASFTADQIHAAVSYLVPEERAIDLIEHRRASERERYPDPPSGRRLAPRVYSREDNIRFGRRDLVTSALNSLRKSGRIVAETIDGETVYRRGPRWIEPDATAS